VEPAWGDPQYCAAVLILALSTDWADYGLHFLIDVLASLATLYAYRFCEHTWHRILVWLGLSLVVTFSTVNLVG
jgi:hypothetical protein